MIKPVTLPGLRISIMRDAIGHQYVQIQALMEDGNVYVVPIDITLYAKEIRLEDLR